MPLKDSGAFFTNMLINDAKKAGEGVIKCLFDSLIVTIHAFNILASTRTTCGSRDPEQCYKPDI